MVTVCQNTRQYHIYHKTNWYLNNDRSLSHHETFSVIYRYYRVSEEKLLFSHNLANIFLPDHMLRYWQTQTEAGIVRHFLWQSPRSSVLFWVRWLLTTVTLFTFIIEIDHCNSDRTYLQPMPASLRESWKILQLAVKTDQGAKQSRIKVCVWLIPSVCGPSAQV